MNKDLHRSKTHSVGSTLIEVLISIAIVVLVLVTMVASGTLVTKNRRFSADQAVASKYGQEAIEWTKAMRNTVGWKTFYDTISAKGNPVTLCLPTLPATAVEFDAKSAGACLASDVITDTPYLRSIVFSVTSSSEIAAQSTVSWTDNTADHQVTTTTVLQEWQ